MTFIKNINFGDFLNEISKKILAFFIIYPEPINTEILIVKMQKEGIKYSKRHIYNTLNELSESGFLIKKSYGKNRTYELNPELLNYSTDTKKNVILLKYFNLQMSIFNEMNINEQINFIHNIFVFFELMKMKDSIELIEDKNKEFEIRKRFDLYEKVKVSYINMLIENLNNKGDKYNKDVKEELDKLIDIYYEEIGIEEKYYK